MKKYILIIVLVITVLFVALNFNENRISQRIENKYDLPINCVDNITMDYKKTHITNENDAVDYASKILIEVYGKDVESTFPLQVQYDEEDKVWVLSGTLDDDIIGGVPYIGILEESGEVIYLSHTK